jgi:hypothetical protein
MGLVFRPRRPLMRLAAGATTASDGERAAPPASSPSDAGATGELERLAKLHASGALTDEEFTAAKAHLLRL